MTEGYKGLQRVTSGHRGLQGVTGVRRTYREFDTGKIQGFTGDYKGVT